MAATATEIAPPATGAGHAASGRQRGVASPGFLLLAFASIAVVCGLVLAAAVVYLPPEVAYGAVILNGGRLPAS